MSEKPHREPASRPGQPTSAAPGTPTKIRVLMERAARREPLFHPQDNIKRVLPNPPPEPEDDLFETELAG